MPRVKIEYVVSFSSEDPENPASNLLALEVSKKKWLCSKGEASCSVVLQLARAVQISAVHIGAYDAALVEVLVGRSEKPNDPFEVLVPSCVFLSPQEARRAGGGGGGGGAGRVRSFSGARLAAGARAQRWDRVRVVCAQPYNKHCRYGLSFIHIYESDLSSSSLHDVSPLASPIPTSAPAVPSRLLNIDTYSSDEDDFRPGELFVKHLQKADASGKSSNTDAQIRQATSQALKNTPDPAIKLTKTPIAKPGHNQQQMGENAGHSRRRNSLMYEDDDDEPHSKIDQVVQRHKDEKSKEVSNKVNQALKTEKKGKDILKASDGKRDANKRDSRRYGCEDKLYPATKSQKDTPSGAPRAASASRPAPTADSQRSKGVEQPPVAPAPRALLHDVVFVLSGYQHPERARIRDAALALGARCARDWGPDCTHLICAFPNTPKLRQVRAACGGARAHVVTAAWLRAAAAQRRRPRERDYAPGAAPPTDSDTDDEIEKVLRKHKRQKVVPPPSPRASPAAEGGAGDADESRDSDVAFVRDERMQGHVSVHDDSDDTDTENMSGDKQQIDPSKALPNFFDGYTFVVEEGGGGAARYVRAYGGALLRADDVDDDTHVDYWVCAGRGRGWGGARGRAGRRVRAAWVWRCHERARRCAAPPALAPRSPTALARTPP